jgi:hypothetical protein
MVCWSLKGSGLRCWVVGLFGIAIAIAQAEKIVAPGSTVALGYSAVVPAVLKTKV